MELKDVFKAYFQWHLNDANNAMESVIQALLPYTMTDEAQTVLSKINDMTEDMLKPIADELGVTYKVAFFAFPVLVQPIKEVPVEDTLENECMDTKE